MTCFQNRVALVTGGSSGIGRATALGFAREGAKVIIADIDSAGGEETVRMVRRKAGDAVFAPTDVTRASQVKAAIERALGTYGRLDYAFNNAGIAASGPTEEFPEELWDRIIDVNLKGVWLCMKYELQPMLKQGYGAIVNTASICGLVGQATSAAYVASKHGVVGMTKTVALEYAKRGVRVNAVCPAWIHTPMVESSLADPVLSPPIIALHPLGRAGLPEEVAEAVIWLCSDAASFVTGHALPVDGGFVAQ